MEHNGIMQTENVRGGSRELSNKRHWTEPGSGSQLGGLLRTNANSKSDTRQRDRNERTTTHVEKDNSNQEWIETN